MLDVNWVGEEFFVKKVKYFMELLIENLNDLVVYLYLGREIIFFNIVDVFFIECIVGFYGENCSFICGKCLNSIVCYYIIGCCD